MSEPRERPVVNIEGELVALGPLCREDIPRYQRWLNDFATLGTLAMQLGPMTLEQETAWYEQAARDAGRPIFTIYERATGCVIGNCGLHEANLLHRRAIVGIVIGEPSERGKGYGTEAMRLLLDYAFTALGMHSVMLSVYEYNHAARRSYEKCGFREIGRRREARWHNGRYWDEILMDMLASEFESPILEALLEPDPPRT